MNLFPVAEFFVSINGEGAHAGELAVFIRFRGCNLRCSYCDTLWACMNDVPVRMISAEELTDMVIKTGVNNVTITGGEPLLQNDLYKLTDMLISCGKRVEIETNGSLSLKELSVREKRPVFTMDYKLPSSNMEKYMCFENFDLLDVHDTVKFVSGSIEDLERAAEIIEKYSLVDRCHVFISPVFGKINPQDIVRFMSENGMNDVRLQLQMHKFIWEPERKGV
ncbi:MAG: putative 7-carboxy-7-deazaguanine synthase QueE [Clostridia bacterium]|nr:putative 7-carboxy-7-deazaguanine synthase QueE [Clostridia bacterium]